MVNLIFFSSNIYSNQCFEHVENIVNTLTCLTRVRSSESCWCVKRNSFSLTSLFTDKLNLVLVYPLY